MAADYIPSSYRKPRNWLQLQKDRLPAIDALLPKVSAMVDLMDRTDALAADLEALNGVHLPVLRQSIRRECPPASRTADSKRRSRQAGLWRTAPIPTRTSP